MHIGSKLRLEKTSTLTTMKFAHCPACHVIHEHSLKVMYWLILAFSIMAWICILSMKISYFLLVLTITSSLLLGFFSLPQQLSLHAKGVFYTAMPGISLKVCSWQEIQCIQVSDHHDTVEKIGRAWFMSSLQWKPIRIQLNDGTTKLFWCRDPAILLQIPEFRKLQPAL